MSLKMSEGHRDKTKNVSKESLNHAGLSGLGTKPKMSEKTGTKLGTDYLTLPSVDNWEMSLRVQKNRYRNKGAMHPPLVTL